MSVASLTILVLAVMRIDRLIRLDRGPKDILVIIRHRAGVRYDEESRKYGTNTLSSLIVCPYCNSVWAGLFVAGIYIVSPDWLWMAALLPLALSAALCFLADHGLIPT